MTDDNTTTSQGTIHAMLTRIIDVRSKGIPTIRATTRTKLILKGINPDNFNADTPDDPRIIENLAAIAKDFGVSI
jgi:hypothetical protein